MLAIYLFESCQWSMYIYVAYPLRTLKPMTYSNHAIPPNRNEHYYLILVDKAIHIQSLFLFPLFRGSLHRRLGDYNAAIDDFLLALDKCEHNEESPVYIDSQRQLLLTYNDFAVECFTKDFYEEAIILLNKAIKGEKREKGLYINRGGLYKYH